MDPRMTKEFILEQSASAQAEGLRAHRYHLETAIADIIDNSISAGATTIDVRFEDSDELRVGVIDNGSGMSLEELTVALTPHARNPMDPRDPDDLGRYFLGLKAASFSQCRRLTVLSRKRGRLSALCLDLDIVTARDRWVAVDPGEPSSLPWSEYLTGDGTIVIWEAIDNVDGVDLPHGTQARARPINKAFATVEKHLGLVFHRFIDGERGLSKIEIHLNGARIEAFDPFNRRHDSTQLLPEELINFDGEEIRVQAYILPHQSKVTPEIWDHYAGPHGYLKGQGFYVYRNRRLIVPGSWLRLRRRSPITQLARIQIDIGNTLDHRWRIGVKKDSAELPQVVKERLSALLNSIDLRARRVYTMRGAKTAAREQQPLWDRQQDAGSITYQVNMAHPLIDSLEQQLNPEEKQRLRTVMRSVASALPIDVIFSDVSTDSTRVSHGLSGALTTTQIRNILVPIYAMLSDSGLSKKQIFDAIQVIEPFRSYEDDTQMLLTELQNQSMNSSDDGNQHG